MKLLCLNLWVGEVCTDGDANDADINDAETDNARVKGVVFETVPCEN